MQRIFGGVGERRGRGFNGSCSLVMEILVCYRCYVGTQSLILGDSYRSVGSSWKTKPDANINCSNGLYYRVCCEMGEEKAKGSLIILEHL